MKRATEESSWGKCQCEKQKHSEKIDIAKQDGFWDIFNGRGSFFNIFLYILRPFKTGYVIEYFRSLMRMEQNQSFNLEDEMQNYSRFVDTTWFSSPIIRAIWMRKLHSRYFKTLINGWFYLLWIGVTYNNLSVKLCKFFSFTHHSARKYAEFLL